MRKKTKPENRLIKLQTPEQIQQTIDLYFQKCEEQNKALTLEGLCLALDIDRATLLNYEKQETDQQLLNIIKRAKQKVAEDIIDKSLRGKYNSTLATFLMKNNFEYEDKQALNIKQEKIIKGISKEQAAEILLDDE